MLAVIASISAGIHAGIFSPLLSPLVYALKFRKDLFLFSFLFYSLALGYEFYSSVYDEKFIALLLSTILLLDSGLKGERRDYLSYIIAGLLVSGIFFKEIFLFAIFLAFFNQFRGEKPAKGLLVLPFVLILFAIYSIKDLAASSQVALTFAISSFMFLFWMKKRAEAI